MATGGLLGLVMGAILLGYMNFYAGCLIAGSGFAPAAFLLAWPVWALVRVVGFVLAGTALGAVLIDRTSPAPEKRRRIVRYLLWSLALTGLDVILKWALAGAWQGVLNGVLPG